MYACAFHFRISSFDVTAELGSVALAAATIRYLVNRSSHARRVSQSVVVSYSWRVILVVLLVLLPPDRRRPLLEAFFERLASLRPERFIDREGELVSIRSDFTPMLARALAPSIASADLPLRVFYRGDVIRCDSSRLGTNREMFQIGAEIIGDDSAAADIEILRLATDLIREFDVRPIVVYTDLSLRGLPVLVAKRTTNGLPSTTATLDDIAPFAPEAAERLAEIAAAVPQFELQLDDFDESNPYYTDLRFRIYDGTSRTRLAEGGRYNKLYATFGTSAPAVGFTFTIDDLD